ncbi:MAG: hypothetical protein WA364_24835 [Candidatus Nitrosopolaris sp.]
MIQARVVVITLIAAVAMIAELGYAATCRLHVIRDARGGRAKHG